MTNSSSNHHLTDVVNNLDYQITEYQTEIDEAVSKITTYEAEVPRLQALVADLTQRITQIRAIRDQVENMPSGTTVNVNVNGSSVYSQSTPVP
jgi:peptidoglycan hydrolase CwlO-like protein